MGHSVQLGEFGVLRPGLRTKAQDTADTANVDAIYRRKINFVPGKMLKSCLKDAAVTRAAESASKTVNDDNSGANGSNPDDEFIDPTA